MRYVCWKRAAFHSNYSNTRPIRKICPLKRWLVRLPAEQVFKTLVVRGDRNGVGLAVVPGNLELDLKAFAKVAGDRKAELVSLKAVQPLTGYIRGGVTALAAKKEYPVFLDETAILFDVISVSAGARGLQILIKPDDYIQLVKATIGDIAKPKL